MSLVGLSPTDSWENAKRKYRRAVLRHHSNKGGRNENFRRVQNEWNNWKQRQRFRSNQGVSRPVPRPMTFTGRIQVHVRFYGKETKDGYGAFQVKPSDTLGEVLTKIKNHKRSNVSNRLFRGFVLSLSCYPDQISNPVVITIPSWTHKNYKLSSFIPHTPFETVDLQVNVRPPGHKHKIPGNVFYI